MSTKTQLQTKIATIEQSLFKMASEHEARHLVVNDLNRLKAELAALENERTFESDTFDIAHHEFNFKANENL